MFNTASLAAQAKLLEEIHEGNVRGAERHLDAGASVNGDLPGYLPLHIAARCGHANVIEMLARRGANLEAAASEAVPDGWGGEAFPKGARALHAAVMSKERGAVQALLEAGADPNPREVEGNTPLLLAVIIRHEDASEGREMVKLLLSRGADAVLANNRGLAPMHHAACRGDTDIIDLIFASAPATLNQRAGEAGMTGLGLVLNTALHSSHDTDRIVGHLLSLGATDKDVPTVEASAFVKAVEQVNESVVRLMLDAAGRRAATYWGAEIFSYAVVSAAGHGLARLVKMLVTAEGEGRQRRWARAHLDGMAALVFAASQGSAATVGVLLAAGADERARDGKGRRASDYAGMRIPVDDVDNVVRKTAAVKRTLERAPAFRARSWVWSAPVASPQGGGAGGAGSGAAGGALCEPSPAPASVRIFRPRDPRFFTTRFDRYSRKL